jgi:hypothetical protein
MMTAQMAEIRFPLRGRQARRGEPAPATRDPLQQMAAQIRELDEAAGRTADRIQDAAASLRLGQAEGGPATRTDLLAGLASALVERTEEIRSDCGRLSALMERTAKLIAERDSLGAPEPQAPPLPPIAPHPVAEEPSAPPADADGPSGAEGSGKPRWLTRGDQRAPTPGGTSEGVRLIATQMAVAGSSRAEIERRLRIQFGVSDADQALDDIFGSRQSEVG